jgi:hypothetical protein
MDGASVRRYAGLMNIALAQIAEREGSTWAIGVHNQMVKLREPLPANFPRTVVLARSIAAGVCGDPAQIEVLAEMIFGHARRAWAELLEDRARECHR